MKKYNLKQHIMLFIAGIVIPAAVYILGSTWRIRFVGKEHEDEAGSPLIWAFWHSRMLPLLFAYRRQGIIILVSQSFDGELIARALRRFGFRTVRGSSSHGGMRSLIEIKRELENGARVAFTPDGPKGPREVVKPGVAAASVKSGAPIIAVAVETDRKWVLGSWDGFQIPKPFGHIEIRLSKPIYPGEKGVDDLTEEVQKKLDEMVLTTKAADSVGK